MSQATDGLGRTSGRARKVAIVVVVVLAWVASVAIQVNYTFGFASVGLFFMLGLLLGLVFAACALVGIRLVSKRWAGRWLWALVFCLSGLVMPGRILRPQIGSREGRVVDALEGYRAQHGRYPDSLNHLSEPLISQGAIRIGWDLRPLDYEPAADGREFRVTFECPAFVVSRYDSTSPGWVHDD